MEYSKAELEANRTSIYSMYTVHAVFEYVKDDALAVKLLDACTQAGFHPLKVLDVLAFLRQNSLDFPAKSR